MRKLLWVVTLVLALKMVRSEDFKISAFNIQIYGKTKAAKPEVLEHIVQIIRNYDIILIQEIRDKSGDSVRKLMQEINGKGDPEYDLVISERLGRTVSKEQYAFIYRKNGIRVVDTFQDPDPEDVFEREPYAVKFHCDKPVVKDFVLVAIHVDKDDAVAEINHLKSFHPTVVETLGTDNVLIMGDFNADASYVPKRKLASLELRAEGFHWLIPDDADTTVYSTDCAYDRFVMTGDAFYNALVPGSAQVVRFDLDLDLSDEQAKAVSDHYPIELALSVGPSYHNDVVVTIDPDDEIDNASSGSSGSGCCGLVGLCQGLMDLFRCK